MSLLTIPTGTPIVSAPQADAGGTVAMAVVFPLLIMGIVVVAAVLHRRRGSSTNVNEDAVDETTSNFSSFEIMNPVREYCLSNLPPFCLMSIAHLT